MKDWKTQQRADFEVHIKQQYAEFEQNPDLSRARTPENYKDTNINAQWWGWQAGQDALMARINEAYNRIPFPDGHSVESRRHWKAGVRDSANAVNQLVGAEVAS